MEGRFCRLCEILDGIPEDIGGYGDKLYRLLKKKDRAGEELMKKRLTVCGSCEKEVNGTCLSCGCYTLYRVMKKDQQCPDKKW